MRPGSEDVPIPDARRGTRESKSPFVLHVSITNTFAGTERVILELASRSVSAGGRAGAVLAESRSLDPFAERLRAAGVLVHRLGDLYSSERNFLRSGVAFARLFRSISPDVAHFHVPWTPMAWEAILAARVAKVPTIVRTEHNPIPDPLGRAQRLKMRVVDRAVDHVVFVSQGVSRTHFANGRRWLRQSSVVPNGVAFDMRPGDASATLRKELGLPLDVLVAVMVGRLELRKGPLDFVRAAACAKDAGSGLHFLVLGGGPLLGEAKALATQLDVHDRVHFAGHREDVTRLLAACDIFVQPSHYEGLSISMLEALAAGLPMASTRVSGLEEVMVGGEGALVSDVGDIGGLARSMVALERDAALRQRFVHILRPYVLDKLSARVMYERYDSLYRELFAHCRSE